MVMLHPVRANTQHTQRSLTVDCRLLQPQCCAEALPQQRSRLPSRRCLTVQHSVTCPPQQGRISAQPSSQYSPRSLQERQLSRRWLLQTWLTRAACSSIARQPQGQLDWHSIQQERTPLKRSTLCDLRHRSRQRLQFKFLPLGQSARQRVLVLLTPSSTVLLDRTCKLRQWTARAQETAFLSRQVRHGKGGEKHCIWHHRIFQRSSCMHTLFNITLYMLALSHAGCHLLDVAPANDSMSHKARYGQWLLLCRLRRSCTG